MFNNWSWRTSLTPDDVFRHPWQWTLISAAEAAAQSRFAPVIVVSRAATGDRAAWYEEHLGFFRGSGPPAHRALRYYQFVAGVPAIPTAAVQAVTAAPPPPAPAPAPTGAPVNPFLDHWIEVQLVDVNDAPVPDEEVLIELPDGSLIEHQKTDADGKLHVPDILDEGTCKISFPNLDARDWVRIG